MKKKILTFTILITAGLILGFSHWFYRKTDPRGTYPFLLKVGKIDRGLHTTQGELQSFLRFEYRGTKDNPQKATISGLGTFYEDAPSGEYIFTIHVKALNETEAKEFADKVAQDLIKKFGRDLIVQKDLTEKRIKELSEVRERTLGLLKYLDQKKPSNPGSDTATLFSYQRMMITADLERLERLIGDMEKEVAYITGTAFKVLSAPQEATKSETSLMKNLVGGGTLGFCLAVVAVIFLSYRRTENDRS